MIISPPLLPAEGLAKPNEKWKTDPMMDVVDGFELSHHGLFPIALDRRWHCGMHLSPYGGLGQLEPVRAIADGDVVAYRVSKNAITDGQKNSDGSSALNSNNGFVLLRHSTDTGDGRTITFYSLYMHLLDLISQNQLSPQPNHPLPDSSPDRLPVWLLHDTEAVKAGDGKKVQRKDRLGFVGKCQGHKHLHFEIFMTEEDFNAYFEQPGHEVGLRSVPSDTPSSTDYWGHTYFVIRKGASFHGVPSGKGSLKTKGNAPKPFFPPLNEGSLDNQSTLYVESFFSRGERFTRSWIDRGDGKLALLTAEPVGDQSAEYEYSLYERATALYPTCPSEGYELLRFGRILSTNEPKLPPSERATWVSVPFDTGKSGYIDVNQSSVLKLSDANFPVFMDWKKIEASHTPFDQDGLCGFDSLCKITGIADRWPQFAAVPEAIGDDARLARYVQSHDDARAKLRGFICHTRSEWDTSWNTERFKGLMAPDGFFGKLSDVDAHGYENFIKFVSQFQFMAHTPLGEGRKFWFFHPLAFIRHFRKCGWLGAEEIGYLVPRYAWITQTGDMLTPLTTSLSFNDVSSRIAPNRRSLNFSLRKYLLASSSERLALFLAQTFIETDRWKTFREYGRGEANPAIPMAQYYSAFYGRGIMQLTWANAYEKYGEFKKLPNVIGNYEGESRISQTSAHYWDDPTTRDSRGHITGVGGTTKIWAPRFNPDLLATDSLIACDSGGFFWIWKHHTGTRNISRIADQGFNEITIDKINKLVNGGSFGYFERFAFSYYTRNILTDWIPPGIELVVNTPKHKRVKVALTRPINL
ncbi:hypothetical protein AWB71_01667 [Caballeronia peredens]|nr:hypothetical protein AWB71_01667 [Caballeronia peredens]